MQINVRTATNSDAESVKILVYGVLREYGLEPDPNGTDIDLSDIETNYIKRGGLFEVLADETGKILGTVGLYPVNAETVELRKMYFDQNLRGRGYGRQTLERMIERARELGFKKIYLETNSVLKEAIGLYKKFGFEPTEEKHSSRCDQAFIIDLKNESTAL
ncbi:MAG: GNAT family N-acetyltransferase [Pyrinomonadaceae bacterium]